MSTQKIFFSYSRADSPFALTLAKDLREAGADIWIDQLDIPAGSHWDAAVEKALNSAAYVLVILTPSSTASTNVMDEVSFALESGKKIIPVLLEDCLAPFRLRRLQRIDFTTDYTTGFSQLIISLNLSLGNAAKSTGIPFENIQVDASTPLSNEVDTKEVERRDNSLWEEACKLNTIASYRRYLSEIHSGSFREEALLMIKQLEVEQKEDELEALLWKKAKHENVKNLFQHYLQEYPQGNYKSLALAALAEFEKAEKEEERRLTAIALQQEKERAQKAKEEKEKQDQLDKEKALRAKEEKEKQDKLEQERLQKLKEEKEKQDKLDREKALKAKEEKEKQEQLEREKAQKAKEEREKQLQIEKEKALKLKQERDKALAVEKEIAQKAKEEREKQLREEREKAQREKAEKEKQIQQEKEKAALLKQQEKEKVRQQRIAQGLPPEESGSGKKYALIGAGVLVLCLGIWLLTKGGPRKDDRTSWKEALEKNDSTAFATYMAAWPEGIFYTNAKERIDSLYWVEKAIKDSLAALEANKVVVAEVIPVQEEAPPVEVVPEPEEKKTPEVKPKTNTPAKPKANTPSTKPTTKTDTKPTNTAPNTPAKITLGQEYGGGIVIYVNPKGDHGMIVSSKEVGSVDFEKAEKICTAYKVGAFGGWKLPSKDELNIIYQNRNHLGGYTKGGYWSSSQEGKNNAWSQNFSDGKQSKSNKQSALAVRAVRPF